LEKLGEEAVGEEIVLKERQVSSLGAR